MVSTDDCGQKPKSNADLLLENLKEGALAHKLTSAYDKDNQEQAAEAVAAVLLKRLEQRGALVQRRAAQRTVRCKRLFGRSTRVSRIRSTIELCLAHVRLIQT